MHSAGKQWESSMHLFLTRGESIAGDAIYVKSMAFHKLEKIPWSLLTGTCLKKEQETKCLVDGIWVNFFFFLLEVVISSSPSGMSHSRTATIDGGFKRKGESLMSKVNTGFGHGNNNLPVSTVSLPNTWHCIRGVDNMQITWIMTCKLQNGIQDRPAQHVQTKHPYIQSSCFVNKNQKRFTTTGHWR